jgi:hypothetical protein
MRAYSPPGSGGRKGLVDLAGVATANSSWELTVGSLSREKPTVTKAATVATPLKKRQRQSCAA